MATLMARDNRERDPAAFRPEDEIDEVFGRANPNPERTGCPNKDVLRSAARKTLPIDHSAYEHLAECSACYREFRQFQQPVHLSSRARPTLAAAAAILLAVAGVAYFGRNIGFGGFGGWNNIRTNAATQQVLIDYRGDSTTRGEAGDADRKSVTVPRANLDATILLPVGSEPGQYKLRLMDEHHTSRLEERVAAELRDFAVRIEVKLDLRSLARGAYSLEIRREGEEWDPHRLVIR
jgi:hypothetical protein